MLAILRPIGSWQQLSFPDPHSREPYRESLAPLIEWLDRVQKLRAQKLSEEEGRNNCLPFAKPELSRRTEKVQEPHASASPNVSAANNGPQLGDRTPQESFKYILRMEESGVAGGMVTMTCTLILNSGGYHFVKQSRDLGSRKVRSMVLDGILDAKQISLLQQILRDPVLQKSRSGPPTSEVYIPTDWPAVASIWMPHDGTVQKFQAWRSLQVVAGWPTKDVEDHGMKPLVPLQQWLKINLNESKAAPAPSPQNAKCMP
jgi:hypothetical protein